MIKRRIYTALLVAAALCFLSVPVPVMAERWHHHRPLDTTGIIMGTTGIIAGRARVFTLGYSLEPPW